MVRTIEGAGIVWSSDGSEQKIGHRPQATGHRKSKATAKPFTTETHHGGLAARRHGEIGGKTKSKAKAKPENSREYSGKTFHHGGHRGAQRSQQEKISQRPSTVRRDLGRQQVTGNQKQRQNLSPRRTQRSTEVSREIFGISSVGVNSEEG